LGPAVQGTFGRNSGQWNTGFKVGVGEGASLDLDVMDSGCQEEGLEGEIAVQGLLGLGAKVNGEYSISDRYGASLQGSGTVGEIGIGGGFNSMGEANATMGYGVGQSIFAGGGVNRHW
jgi:hypothetical protein